MSPAPMRRLAGRIGARGMLRAMLGLQLALAGFVVLGDLGTGGGRLWPAANPAPGPDVPVRPGDQTRRYAPQSLPGRAPEGPGFPAGEGGVPSSLRFSTGTVAGVADTLLVTGTIAPGDGARFRRLLDERPALPAAVALHSPGGSVSDALEIGQEIRTRGLNTVMAPQSACFSACPYILAGGVARQVSRGAMVGVHQHYFGQNTLLPAFLAVSDVQRGQAEVMTYLDAMGVDPMVMSRALATPPDDIYVLVPEELAGWKLATVLVD